MGVFIIKESGCAASTTDATRLSQNSAHTTGSFVARLTAKLISESHSCVSPARLGLHPVFSFPNLVYTSFPLRKQIANQREAIKSDKLWDFWRPQGDSNPCTEIENLVS